MDEKIFNSLQTIIEEIRNLNEQSKECTRAVQEQNDYFAIVKQCIEN